MDQNKFDVLIIGAGPAGGSCARELAKKGRKVLLVEKNKIIGQPNFSSAATPDYVLEEFGLPQNIVGDFWDKLQITSPSDSYTWNYGKTRGYVLKFDELKKFLVKDAEESGCIVWKGTEAVKIFREGENITSIELLTPEKKTVKAKIIVDASGPPAFIAKQVGLRDHSKDSLFAVGVEYIMKKVSLPEKNVLAFWLGHKYAPNGYSWIFPMGGDTVKVGICMFKIKNEEYSLKELLNNFVDKIPYLKGAEKTDFHGGSIYRGAVKNFVLGNLIGIGDAMCQINPLGGEGVRHALRSGRMAAFCINEALENNDLKKLLRYNKMWKEYTGKSWIQSYHLAQLVYLHFTEELFDKYLELIKTFPPQEVFDLLFEYKFGQEYIKLIKKIPYIPYKLGKDLWNHFGLGAT